MRRRPCPGQAEVLPLWDFDVCTNAEVTNTDDTFRFASTCDRPGPPGGDGAPFAFPTVNRYCTARLYGGAGRLTAQKPPFPLPPFPGQ